LYTYKHVQSQSARKQVHTFLIGRACEVSRVPVRPASGLADLVTPNSGPRAEAARDVQLDFGVERGLTV
jgi:hypothetical protein